MIGWIGAQGKRGKRGKRWKAGHKAGIKTDPGLSVLIWRSSSTQLTRHDSLTPHTTGESRFLLDVKYAECKRVNSTSRIRVVGGPLLCDVLVENT